jgi:dolichol-phosphate mannosyltransferase
MASASQEESRVWTARRGERPRGVASRLARSRFARFAAVGASGVAVNLSALALLAGALGLHEVLASALAIEVSILWNFVLNDAFTFRDRNAGAAAGPLGRLLRYNAVSLLGLALQLGAFVALRAAAVHGLGREGLGNLRYPAQAAGIVIALAWNFAGNMRFTWRQRPATPAREGAA